MMRIPLAEMGPMRDMADYMEDESLQKLAALFFVMHLQNLYGWDCRAESAS